MLRGISFDDPKIVFAISTSSFGDDKIAELEHASSQNSLPEGTNQVISIEASGGVLTGLLLYGQETKKLHDDILLCIHSHPVLRGEKLDKAIIPSPVDMDVFEDMSAQNFNTVHAIAATDGETVQVLLWRSSPESTQKYIQYLTDVSYYETGQLHDAESLTRALEESGIATSILTLSLKQPVNWSEYHDEYYSNK